MEQVERERGGEKKKKGAQWRGGAERVMSKKDACYANGWCSGAVRPPLMDGPLEVTSGTGWSGFGAKNRRAATPGWANVRGRKEQKN